MNMDTEIFESSEFYRRRYDNFSTMIVFPVFLAVVGILLFSFVGHREITVKTVGEIAPAGTVAQVQSTSNQHIVVNNLMENKVVRKGDTLLAYDDNQDSTQMAALQQQLDVANRQQVAAQQLKVGLQNDTNPFSDPDEFGYSSMLDDYRAQAAVTTQDDGRDAANVNSQNQAVAAARDAANQQLSENEAKLADYRELRQAVAGGGQLPADNIFASTYQLYHSQIEENPSQQGSITAQTLSGIDSSVRELEQTSATVRSQQASTSFSAKSTSSGSKISALHAQYVLEADKELSKISSTKLELETKIALGKSQGSASTVKAKCGGILHVNSQIKGMDTIPNGTVVAQIYPDLDHASNIEIVLDVPADDIDGIHNAQQVRFSSYQNSAKPLIINGSIISVASSPTRTRQGNYYEIRARASVDDVTINRIRYGFQGTAVIITGKKTFFDYYKDRILHP
ncbi:competence factor transport accessory protein ComB [Bifidobacterium bohemicum]|uniref:Competence factor transport accessory protein, ComB n=2 Tax=Bifidobacterium bohemicum TaxID=638617 RepID=A0A086ZK78_9BIFI|nr:Competence factor transport accessory protein, ComB [Bifidobacterium bohemicum DSM 22767]SCB85321.1 competence factor transport accessory protein ComB [Bifidobacterium bohemicum]